MEVGQNRTRPRPASARREAGSGAAFAWDRSGRESPARTDARFQQRTPAWFEVDEWNRLPWLPDDAKPAPEAFDPALPLWVFVATFMIASASYSAGHASPRPSSQSSHLAETIEHASSVVRGLFADDRADGGELAGRPATSQDLPPIGAMTPRERQRVAIELSFAQATTSGAFDPSPEPNAPY